jgi:peptide/nickel transport system ATP-binding protein
MLFIAHDLAVVKHISDRVAVMYLGKLCEVAPSDVLHSAPAHPYTRLLLDSVVTLDDDLGTGPRSGSGEAKVPAEPPSPTDPPSGCRFRSRCPRAADVCADVEPTIRAVGPAHHVACHFPGPGGEATSQVPERWPSAATTPTHGGAPCDRPSD